jgi:uncharacterized membrane protein YhhN
MSKTNWLSLFFLITAADVFAIATENEDLRWLTKSFIMPLLMGYTLSSLTLVKSVLHKWVIAALTCSWAGDLLLLLESQHSMFFVLGLAAFLIAHICYIDFFQIIKIKREIKINWLLFPHLGSMKIPVIIYGAIISAMLVFALHLPFMKYKKAGNNMMAGAILFVTSDSILAINKFYNPFENAGILIILTYVFAQLLIVSGAVRYIRSAAAE